MGSPSSRRTHGDAAPPRLLLLGANHRTCPVDGRELLLERVTYSRISRVPAVEDRVLLRTCNRVEAYVLSRNPTATSAALRRTFALRAGVGTMYELEGLEAVAHLLRVASGLDSIALGESQISGQVRRAPAERPKRWRRERPLAHLFERAARVSARLRRLAGVDQQPISASHAAVRYVRDVVGSSNLRITLLGSGKMARLAAEALAGDARLWVVNRNFRNAQAMARRLGGRAAPLSRLSSILGKTDVLLAATSSTDRIVKRTTLARARRTRPRNPLWIVDLGVPRNVDPSAARLDGVRLLTIDDLAPWTGPAPDPEAMARAERRIRQEAQALWDEIQPRAADHVHALRIAAEQIRRVEVEWAFAHMAHATEFDRTVVDKMADRLVNRLLHGPTELVRRLEAEGREGTIADLLPRASSGGRR